MTSIISLKISLSVNCLLSKEKSKRFLGYVIPRSGLISILESDCHVRTDSHNLSISIYNATLLVSVSVDSEVKQACQGHVDKEIARVSRLSLVPLEKSLKAM